MTGIKRLAEVRQAAGMTQEMLSAASGVHRVTIARTESGKTIPSIDTVARLADALGVTVDELIDKQAG